MDAKQLEKMMGFAPGELEKAAAAYEKDEWPKGHTVKLGRRCFIGTCGRIGS